MKVCAGLVFWMTLFLLLSAQEQDNIEVKYPSKIIKAERGSTVKLSCLTEFNFLACNDLHAAWHVADRNTEPTEPTELTDPLLYLTTVSEKIIGVNRRARTVITDILSVTEGDSGRYQCKADCSGQIEMGHFITVEVTDKSLQ
ncbi:hypothetical protein FQA47_011487 [Oryzias melastigma]|uniref:Ig-like domain-containing protein n=1 Tax=Oryzias melastigma TaxID=30732 RepID=A0A834FH71_ORYME|nr:hypothetical protein FQA47_011487 [Oryzias melastigma]